MSGFRALCQGFCAIQGLPEVDIDEGGGGLQAFTLDVGECRLSVLHDPLAAPDALFLVAEIDAVLSPEDELQAWLSLLEANYWMRAASAPVFSRNPQSGEVVLQWTLPYAQASAQMLHDAVSSMCALVQRWNPGRSKTTSNAGSPRELMHMTFA